VLTLRSRRIQFAIDGTEPQPLRGVRPGLLPGNGLGRTRA
jgi:hypothetical protein